MVSKVHCILVYDGESGDFLLEDCSSNGVFVDGKRLVKEQVHRYSQEVAFALASQNCMIKAGVAYE